MGAMLSGRVEQSTRASPDLSQGLRVMLHTHWSAEAWSQVRVEFKRAVALRSEIRRAGWFIN
jgi:hypothetical protein